MKRTRKILALLLCIVMCLSLFPVSAVAAEEEPAEVVTDEARGSCRPGGTGRR